MDDFSVSEVEEHADLLEVMNSIPYKRNVRAGGVAKNIGHGSRSTFKRIYFVRHLDTQAIKIGRSDNPHRRLKQLRKSFFGRMALVGSVGSGFSEQALHLHLAKWALGKEWFKDSPEVNHVMQTCLTKGIAEGIELAKLYEFD